MATLSELSAAADVFKQAREAQHRAKADLRSAEDAFNLAQLAVDEARQAVRDAVDAETFKKSVLTTKTKDLSAMLKANIAAKAQYEQAREAFTRARLDMQNAESQLEAIALEV